MVLNHYLAASNFENVMFIVIGTDGSVIPIDDYLRQKGCFKILCNKYNSDHIFENVFDYYYEKSIIDALPEIDEKIQLFLNLKLKKEYS